MEISFYSIITAAVGLLIFFYIRKYNNHLKRFVLRGDVINEHLTDDEARI